MNWLWLKKLILLPARYEAPSPPSPDLSGIAARVMGNAGCGSVEEGALSQHSTEGFASEGQTLLERDRQRILLSEDAARAIDIHSPTWRFVRSWAESSLKKARDRNDNLNKDATQTAALRGEIRVLKELISLPEPKPGLLDKEFTETSEVYGY